MPASWLTVMDLWQQVSEVQRSDSLADHMFLTLAKGDLISLLYDIFRDKGPYD